MRLDPQARRYYRLEVTTTPTDFAPTEWEASFDGGLTWKPAVEVDGLPAWLIAGPSAEIGEAVAVVAKNVRPKIRVEADPEIEIENTPHIIVE